jgi:ABC-2 type transport system ATP-binding protein
MIDVSNLTKFHGPNRSLDGVTFRVEPGDLLGFLGPNGAGKTTTMRILAGLARPTSGEARIDGHDVQRDHEKIRPILGYLPEQAPLYGDMTLAGYLQFMAGLKGLDHRAARLDMERTTDLVNLKNERKRLIRNLSKGTRQRAALAAALLGDPKLLILDEPTVGLDPAQINDVRALIRSMKGKRTVILSTHILPEVELTCSRLVIIAAGRIVAQGTPDELVSGIDKALVVVARGSEQKLGALIADCIPTAPVKLTRSGDTVEARLRATVGEDQRAALSRRIIESGLELLELRVEQARLEDVFLRAVGRSPDQ